MVSEGFDDDVGLFWEGGDVTNASQKVLMHMSFSFFGRERGGVANAT